MADALILDVGHGSAAVIVDDGRALVIDTGSQGQVADTLAAEGVDRLDIVISHQHHDHTSELPSLLSDPNLHVGKLFLNADPTRNPTTKFEKDLRVGFQDSYERNSTELLTLNATLAPAQFSLPNLAVEVLWPGSATAFGGVGATKASGVGTVHPHAMAGVVRISHPSGRSVLLCADVNHTNLLSLADSGTLQATVLVYPHHGGLSGSNNEEKFATTLTTAVAPEVVVFSHGRDVHQNPRPEVIRGVRAARVKPAVRVLCTQLSKNCAPAPTKITAHLEDALSHAGKATGASCCGTLRVRLDGSDALIARGSEHLAFVLEHVDGNHCMAQAVAPSA
ncbi:ComEC/Rec2 family competence protein [Patulibacter defluvii]|uniref:ComEC/Rec2 family competence protein n=1 Tax=Patulibacter defluvii TaxID=3095358 RepID=UPI002A756D9B|nr:MBL fold metallo-hydrolase [Patulibacter sp. DM4]